MNPAFSDTLYWVALIVPRDPWAEKAQVAKVRLGNRTLITTEEVLVEVLTSTAGMGPHFRKSAVELVDLIMNDSKIEVVRQSHESFTRGLEFYRKRVDKAYSLVDCISMTTMRQRGITEVLTNDHHFEQEGFVVLIR